MQKAKQDPFYDYEYSNNENNLFQSFDPQDLEIKFDARMRELIERQNNLEDTLLALERFKIETLKEKTKVDHEVNKLAVALKRDDLIVTSDIKMDFIQENDWDYIKIQIGHLLPHYKRLYDEKTYSKQYMLNDLKYYYTLELSLKFKELQEKNGQINFEKGYVFIHQYFKHAVRDLDNRYNNFLFNAMKEQQIVSDDNWKNLMYTEKGSSTKTGEYTEIYITHQEHMWKLHELIMGT